MKTVYPIVCIVLLITMLACNLKNESRENKDTGFETLNRAATANSQQPDDDQQPFYPDSAGRQSGNDKKQPRDAQQPVTRPDWDKKIIKTAIVNAEVKDYHVFYASMREKVKALGGYVAQEEQVQSEYKIENSLLIKVPVSQFDNAMMQLAAGLQTVNEKKITSQDVTTEVVDTRSRMEAKRQVRLRYMDLLKQAHNMEDILKVQSTINGVQEEIESAAGRMEFLNHAAVFSTIHLTYYQVLNLSAKDTARPSFAVRLGNAFRTGRDWMAALFVGLVAVWPLFLLAFAAFVIYKKNRGAKNKGGKVIA